MLRSKRKTKLQKTAVTREELFVRDWNGDLSVIDDPAVKDYSVKLIYSGHLLEAEFFPRWDLCARHKAKVAVTPEAQRSLNERNSKKQFIRKVVTNFTKDDLYMTFTYDGDTPELSEVKKDVANYIRRVRYYRKKNGLPELRYLYYIHGGHHDPNGRMLRIHVHVFMSAMDRDVAEQLWNKGRANAKRLQPDREDGLLAISKYTCRLMKVARLEFDEPNIRQWEGSRNLCEPVVEYPRHRITRHRAVRMARDAESAGKLIEAQFPEYRLMEPLKIKQSDYVGGAYMYAKLYRKSAAEVKCRFCDARVRVIHMNSGQDVECDPDLVYYKKHRNGADCVVSYSGDIIACEIVGKADDHDGAALLPHWTSCPKAAKFRAARKKAVSRQKD